jgi:DNA adenine methylase
VKWHGGKSYLAQTIVSMMPRHLNYVEPYFGGGAVLFARDPDDESLWLAPHKGVSEVVNDLNGELANFWTTLQNKPLFDLFARLMSVVPFSGVEYQAAVDGLKQSCECNGYDANGGNQVVRAAWFFIVNRMSLAGRMQGFTGITKTRTRARMNNEVSAWLSCVDRLPEVHARLRRALILPPQKALSVIRKFDMPETLFYLDPPYLHETRATTGEYAHEMTYTQHRELLELLKGIKGKFLLSGYDNDLYRGYANTVPRWDRRDFELPNQVAGGKTKRRMIESLWCNFPVSGS